MSLCQKLQKFLASEGWKNFFESFSNFNERVPLKFTVSFSVSYVMFLSSDTTGSYPPHMLPTTSETFSAMVDSDLIGTLKFCQRIFWHYSEHIYSSTQPILISKIKFDCPTETHQTVCTDKQTHNFTSTIIISILR